MGNLFVVLFRQEMPENQLCLSAEFVPSGEDIYGEDQPDEKVNDTADQPACPCTQCAHCVRNVGGQAH